MLRTITQSVRLPVGPKPDYELESDTENDEEGENKRDLKDIAESAVLFQSLKQSREKWLLSTFPKFSSKTRGGKNADHPPPPRHMIHSQGRCDLHVGPHVFYDTAIFEVQYLPPLDSSATHPYQYQYQPPPQQTGLGTTLPGSGATAYGSASLMTSLPEAPPPPRAATPLLSTLASPVAITPDLIAQVNTAAATNPTLAHLLQRAASGTASPEQLHTLGLLIQSLANTADLDSNATTDARASVAVPTSMPAPSRAPTASTSAASAFNPKPFDIVLEFRETPSDRWTFPRVPVSCQRADGGSPDLLLTTAIPFPPSAFPSPQPTTGGNSSYYDKGKSKEAVWTPPQRAVTIRLANPPPTLYEFISQWAGGSAAMEEHRRALDTLGKEQRQYLVYRIPEGSLLTQIQNAARPQPLMKSIKPVNDSPVKVRARRKYGPRAPKTAPEASLQAGEGQGTPSTNGLPLQGPLSATPQPDALTGSQAPAPAQYPQPFTQNHYPASASYSPPPGLAVPVFPQHPQLSSISAPPQRKKPGPKPGSRRRTDDGRPPKRPKPAPPQMPAISCKSCGQTDVPLILGGRFCRPCVESGKVDVEIPVHPANVSGSGRGRGRGR